MRINILVEKFKREEKKKRRKEKAKSYAAFKGSMIKPIITPE